MKDGFVVYHAFCYICSVGGTHYGMYKKTIFHPKGRTIRKLMGGGAGEVQKKN